MVGPQAKPPSGRLMRALPASAAPPPGLRPLLLPNPFPFAEKPSPRTAASYKLY